MAAAPFAVTVAFGRIGGRGAMTASVGRVGRRSSITQTIVSRLGMIAGALVIGFGLVTFAAPGPAFGSALTTHTSFTCAIKSLAANRYVTLATAPTGSLHYVLVATMTTPAPKAAFQCGAIAGNQWTLKSPGNNRYVTAQFAYAGKYAGSLRAQATNVTAAEKYSFVHEASCNCYAIRVGSKYVATETSYTGTTHNLLRARATTFAAAEQFSIVATQPLPTTTTKSTTSTLPTTTTTVPPPPPGVATALAVGTTHACLVTNAGGARCWGNSATGPRPGPSSAGPVQA